MVNHHGSAHAWHNDVGQHEAGLAGHPLERANRVLGAFGHNDVIALLRQNRFDKAQDIRFVVHHQDGLWTRWISCNATHKTHYSYLKAPDGTRSYCIVTYA